MSTLKTVACGGKTYEYDESVLLPGPINTTTGLYFPAHEIGSDHDVVLKVLCPFADRPGDLRRIECGYQLWSKIHHENVVKLISYRVGLPERTHDSMGVAVMENWGGRTLLGEMERSSPFSEAKARCVMRNILRGMSEPLAHGFAHNTLIPGNVAVGDNGVYKIFGFEYAQKHISVRTFTSVRIPFVYEAPEKHPLGHPTPEGSDIYSAGVILREMITGSPVPVAAHDLFCTNSCADLITGMTNPVSERIRYVDTLHHHWFSPPTGSSVVYAPHASRLGQ